jgi:hypothetical protein
MVKWNKSLTTLEKLLERLMKKKQTKCEQRLKTAKLWLPKYDGKHIVKGYRKHFGVDIMCAITELQMLGYEFTSQHIECVKKSIEAERIKRQEKKEQKKLERFENSDDTFYYIAGYTSGGAPYGITWEEMGLEPYSEVDE